MATILEFRSSDEPRRPAAQTTRRTAEIVIFPGVRYDRRCDAGASNPPTAPVTRDVLTLVD
jgi:hypothetical protein